MRRNVMTFLALACCGWWWLLAGSTPVPRFLGAHAVAGAVQQTPAAITVLVPADAALFFDGFRPGRWLWPGGPV
jgi:hypothetical protein